MNSVKYLSTQSIKESKRSVQYEKKIGLLKLIFYAGHLKLKLHRQVDHKLLCLAYLVFREWS